MSSFQSFAERRPSGWRGRVLRSALALSTCLTLGAALAQEALGAEVCASTRNFVDATINGAGRGGTLLISRAGEVWISAELLRPSESRYAAQTVACPDGTFVRLNPLLNVTFDHAELTLDVRARSELLPGNVLDLTPRPGKLATGSAALPVTSLGVQVSAKRVSGDGAAGGVGTALFTQRVSVRGAYRTGSTTLSLEGTESGDPANPHLTLNARSAYAVNDTLGLGLALYAVSEAGSDRAFGLSWNQISGLEVRLGATRAYRIPSLTFDLPLDAGVTVSVNGGAGQAFQAQAGILTLKNIPVSTPSGTISLRIHDATGTHQLERHYQVSDVVISARGFAGLGHLGAVHRADATGGLELSPAADFSGTYGLNDTWSLGGQLRVSRALAQGQFSVRYTTSLLGAGIAAEYDSSRRNSLFLIADALYTKERWQVASAVRLVPLDAVQTQFSAHLSYHAQPTALALRLQATPGLASYGVGANLTRRVNSHLTLGGDFTYTVSPAQGAAWKAAVQLAWQPQSALTVLAQSESLSTPGGRPAIATNTKLSYELAPGSVLFGAVNVAGGEVVGSVGYSGVRNVTGTVEVNTRGDATLDLTAGLSLVGGQLFVNASEPGPGILIRTGVPNLPLNVGGQLVVTDGRGDALVLLGDGVRDVTVTPDFGRIPVTVTVQDDLLEVRLDHSGVVVVNWTQNFTQNVWLKLVWPDGRPIAYGSVQLAASPGQTFISDDQGWALVPTFTTPSQLKVTEDPSAGTRRCAGTAQPGDETVPCQLDTP